MKSLNNYIKNLNEQKLDGYNLTGDLSKTMFGTPVKSLSMLKKGNEYIMLDLGRGEWLGNFEYKGLMQSMYVFSSTLQDNDVNIEYTHHEIMSAIEKGELHVQKNLFHVK